MLLLQNSARNAEEYHRVTPLNIVGWHCGNETHDSFYSRCIEPLLNHRGNPEAQNFMTDLEVVKGLGLLIHYNHVETLRMALDRAVSLPDALTLETGLRLP
jgi:hypothetical protein